TGVLLSDGKRLPSDAVIVATGGMSYASTGSTGDGYRFAKKLSHTVKEPVPALVPLTVKEEWCRLLQGLSLKNVSVTLFSEKKKK
ncbi:aminoacetone oxidase family FAD-binding enzyme, partial [bacterium]|nr:aminoacetone oxidase family FAD-binding enzyme [bacterium]